MFNSQSKPELNRYILDFFRKCNLSGRRSRLRRSLMLRSRRWWTRRRGFCMSGGRCSGTFSTRPPIGVVPRRRSRISSSCCSNRGRNTYIGV
ncbi:Hypothetical protein J6888_01786 [Nakaseomyces glabratus]